MKIYDIFVYQQFLFLVIDILSLSSASRSNDEVVDRGRILWLDNIDIPKPELSISFSEISSSVSSSESNSDSNTVFSKNIESTTPKNIILSEASSVVESSEDPIPLPVSIVETPITPSHIRILLMTQILKVVK